MVEINGFFNKILLTSISFFRGGIMYWVLAVAVLVVGQVEGKVKETVYGVEAYSGEKLEALQVYGTIRLDDCKVMDSLEVNGELRAVGSEFGRVKVNGYGVVENCLIKKKVAVQGLFEATNTKFLDKVILFSDRVVFDSCTIDSLQIRESAQDEVVELKGSTKVNGTIKFDSGRGTVIKGADVEFAGKLIGGAFQ